MSFRNKYERVVTTTNPGDFDKPVFGSEYDKEHRLVVVKKGIENWKAYINSFAESVDINVILNRFRNGDRRDLLDRVGDYVDISMIPDNINDLMAVSKNLESAYDRLPVDIKNMFNNNVKEFIAQAGTDEWAKKLAGSEYDVMRKKDEDIKAVTKANQDIVNHAPILNPGDVDVLPVEPDEPVLEMKKRGVTK